MLLVVASRGAGAGASYVASTSEPFVLLLSELDVKLHTGDVDTVATAAAAAAAVALVVVFARICKDSPRCSIARCIEVAVESSSDDDGRT